MRRLLLLAPVLLLAGTGCPYLRSAAKQAFLAEHPEAASERMEAGSSPGGASPVPRERAGFPSGTVRSLDDELFSPETVTLGLYDPASFLEQAPALLYALEEDDPDKVPVVLVHGISGSPRDFTALLARLDRSRFQPWFFYYPSGRALSELGATFHRRFLSGEGVARGRPVVVVAHSMGGLVVREALNHCTGAAEEARVARLVTIASPLGGYPGAAGAARGPLRVPSWQDLLPGSPFLAQLHRRPLPAGLDYQLFYTFGNTSKVKLGENSDGVVPLSSQLTPAAQDEAHGQFGFDATHTGVLEDPEALRRILEVVEGTRPPREGATAATAP